MTIWGSAYESLSLEEKCAELNRLIAEWREPGFVSVRPARVVPDTTNREGTGISAMHVHFVAHSIQSEGFETRDDVTGAGHDVPFLVREVTGAASELGGESLAKWARAQAENAELPPAQPWAAADGEEYFCSLGNSHFFQALNHFGAASRRKFRRRGDDAAPVAYSAAADAPLRSALDGGVRSVVLRREMPKQERRFVSQMLNAAFEYSVDVDAGGGVRVDPGREVRQFGSFGGLTKHADAWQLDELVEMKARNLGLTIVR